MSRSPKTKQGRMSQESVWTGVQAWGNFQNLGIASKPDIGFQNSIQACD